MELLASCNKPCATHADAAVSALRHATQIGATGEQEAAERHRGYIALSASPHFDTASAQYKDQRTRCGGATDDDRPASSLQPPRRRTHVCVNWKPTGFPSSRIWREDVRVLAAILNFEFVRGQKEAPRSCWQWLEFGEIVDGWTIPIRVFCKYFEYMVNRLQPKRAVPVPFRRNRQTSYNNASTLCLPLQTMDLDMFACHQQLVQLILLGRSTVLPGWDKPTGYSAVCSLRVGSIVRGTGRA
ncbi:hypothetical protein B0H16DRAFT_1473195 [Mycena metata]|uniref:Uncharacterized protein n=1 Tax=Mycena metata TaxID=1033252 RepID=A0AAD7HL52_9AGAR|nr:hypothetical protein B0H16DRAFT_1473195 [Mycena metata]